jgi:hypothetical protein
METISKLGIDNDELTCPITYETFHDPVIATDGHVYEREAITKWILLKGTSPLTRQPLSIEELQPNADVRCPANQRHNCTVSHNIRPDGRASPIITQTQTEQVTLVRVLVSSNKPGFKLSVVIFMLIFIIVPIVSIIIYTATKTTANSCMYDL